MLLPEAVQHCLSLCKQVTSCLQDVAAFKLQALHKQLEEMVPSADLEKANKEYMELTEKYRDILEKENTLILHSKQVENLEVDLDLLLLSLLHSIVYNNPPPTPKHFLQSKRPFSSL